jgi:phosphate starvation-inducible membrane PsiE
MENIYEKTKNILLAVCHVMEIIMSCILVLVIVIVGVRLILEAGTVLEGDPIEKLETFISTIMTVAIGVELVKMLAQHDASTIIEVLMFAIARMMIVNHGSTLEILLGVAAIAILFATRKYLFISTDSSELK